MLNGVYAYLFFATVVASALTAWVLISIVVPYLYAKNSDEELSPHRLLSEGEMERWRLIERKVWRLSLVLILTTAALTIMVVV